MRGYIWAEAPCPAGRIIELLTRTDPAWHPKAVKAFLNRFQRAVELRWRDLSSFNFKGFLRRPASFPILEPALGRGCASKRTVHTGRHFWYSRA
jgi:hypothetical protein